VLARSTRPRCRPRWTGGSALDSPPTPRRFACPTGVRGRGHQMGNEQRDRVRGGRCGSTGTVIATSSTSLGWTCRRRGTARCWFGYAPQGMGGRARTRCRRLGVKGQRSASAAPNSPTSSSRSASASLSTDSTDRQVGAGGCPARHRRGSRVAGQLPQPVLVAPPSRPAHASLTHPILPSTAVVHWTQSFTRSAFELCVQRLPAPANKTAIKSPDWWFGPQVAGENGTRTTSLAPSSPRVLARKCHRENRVELSRC
jgi:hypothetical protein